MKRILIVVLSICLFSSILTCNAQVTSSAPDSTIVDAYNSVAIRNDIISYYNLESKTNVTVTYKSSNYTYLVNLNQAQLEFYYGVMTGNYANESCSSTAVVDLIKHFNGLMDTQNAYNSFLNQAYINGYFTSNRGQLQGSKYKQGITLCASQNSVSGNGAEYTYNKRARTRNALNNNQLVLLSLGWANHSVVATGIEKYTVSYIEGGTVHSFEAEYFMVNENWARAGGSLVLAQRFSDSTGAAFILQ
jgi:hypothetical protein